MATEKFHFKGADGKDYSLPLFRNIPMGIIRKTRKAESDDDRLLTMVELLLGEESKELAAIDSLTPEEFGAVVHDWTQGASLGE